MFLKLLKKLDDWIASKFPMFGLFDRWFADAFIVYYKPPWREP